MNLLIRKITICLFTIVLCFDLITATAEVFSHCVDQKCCCCFDGQMDDYGPTRAEDSIGHPCCSSSEKTTCKINVDTEPGAKIFLITSSGEKRKVIDDLFALFTFKPTFLTVFTETGTTRQFWIAGDPIPKYLQNHSYLC